MATPGDARARPRWSRRIRLTLRALAGWGLEHLPLGERLERVVMRVVWRSGSAEMLDAYLVSGYQNPRINVQSILLRHYLTASLLGPSANALMQDEIRFAIELNDVLRQRAAELGVTMGTFRDPERHAAVRRVDAAIADRETTFTGRWAARLADDRAEPTRIRVLEFACGSANDYRAVAECGLGSRLDYVGVDISPKNIENARRRFPSVTFDVADILRLDMPDQSFDVVIASDLFEHLSPSALDHALAEAARLARVGVVLTFFNMAEAPEHVFRRRRTYHWNTVSRARVAERLHLDGMGIVECLPIAAWLDAVHGYGRSYNPDAWTIVAERRATTIPLWPHRGAADRSPMSDR